MQMWKVVICPPRNSAAKVMLRALGDHAIPKLARFKAPAPRVLFYSLPGWNLFYSVHLREGDSSFCMKDLL